MVDIFYILKGKLLPVKGVPRKAEIIQQNRTEQNRWDISFDEIAVSLDCCIIGL